MLSFFRALGTSIRLPLFLNCPPVGGQAVMEGVMMRNQNTYGLAIRTSDGDIKAGNFKWFTLIDHPLVKTPFLRGFPLLLETLINGIKALNKSAAILTNEEEENLTPMQLILTLGLAILMALALFVVTPHLLSLVMLNFNLGGDVEGLSFHLWDGLFKSIIFLGYIKIIGFIPDIKRVFQYHGAEHKTIHAFESGEIVTASLAKDMSRLHPRCGTTFLLFVIVVSIILHAIIVPALLILYTPQSVILKHTLVISYKLLLTIPISAIAYEIIRYAAKMEDGILASILRSPGLFLQKLTTEEPDIDQLNVAVVALKQALKNDENIKAENVECVSYSQI